MRTFLLFSLIFSGLVYGQSADFNFIENKGQWHEAVKFKAHVPGGSIYLESTGVTYKYTDLSDLLYYHTHPSEYNPKRPPSIKGHVIKVDFLGAEKGKFLRTDKGQEYYNFYLGNNPKNWASKIHPYKTIEYQSIYPNIDLKWYTQAGHLKYDFIVHPEGSVEQIQLAYTGQDKLSLKQGKLVMHTQLGKIEEEKPFVYQIINGKVKIVPCNFILDENTRIVTYNFPEGYSKTVDLIIDPTLIFSTYSGSVPNNFGMTATYDLNGNLFSGGIVFDDGFPTTAGAYDSNFDGLVGAGLTDIAITKYDATGLNQIYSTYLGGDQCETVHSLIINDQEELFLFGLTGSNNFPTSTNAYDASFNGGIPYNSAPNGTNFVAGTDIFVSKFNQNGTALLGSTYIGGSGNDGINYNNAQATSNLAYDSLLRNYGDQFRGEVMVDDLGNCYVATCSKSTDFPIVNGFGNTIQGGQAGVVLKFNQDLSVLEWSTFLNGENKDAAYALKVDTDHNVFVAGGTSSTTFPTTSGAYQTTYGGGIADGFMCKISNNGSTLLHASFIGTNAFDQAYFLEYDRHVALNL